MDGKLVTSAVVLLLLGINGLLVNAEEESVYDHIDKISAYETSLAPKEEFYKIFMGLLEERGAKEVDEIKQFVEELNRSVQYVVKVAIDRDDFGLYKEGLKRYPDDPARIMREVGPIGTNLAALGRIRNYRERGERMLNIKFCHPQLLEIFLNTVRSVFGDDFNAFANEKPTHHAGLHAYLLDGGINLVAICFNHRPVELSEGEVFMKKLVSLGESIDNEKKLLRRAKEFDLMTTKMNAPKILRAAVSYYSRGSTLNRLIRYNKVREDAIKELNERIIENCLRVRDTVKWIGVMAFDFFHVGRVLLPELTVDAPRTFRFQKLFEYNRICMPIYKQKQFSVVDNEEESDDSE